VGKAIRGVLELEEALVESGGVRVDVGFVPSGLVAAVHPSVLRQTLITAIRRLGQHVSPGPVEVYATLEDGLVKLTITGEAPSGHRPSDDDLVRGVVAPLGASVHAHWRGSRVFLQARLPAVGRRTVLVVEDNLDMVHFFRRCTAGTPYRIIHVTPDQDVIETIESSAPDVVVLDVMLPEVDGWQLLNHLHERPATRSIPVIVCSVVREEKLALALGAVAYLQKPVQPRRFVGVLDQVVRQGQGEASRAQSKSALA
jgi:CheY-like chemotaxis protein